MQHHATMQHPQRRGAWHPRRAPKALLPLSELEFRIEAWDIAGAEDLTTGDELGQVRGTGEALAEEVAYVLRGIAARGRADIPVAADLAFVANMEANHLREALAALEGCGQKWRVLEVCQRTKQHLLRAVTAVGKALLEDPAHDDARTQFRSSLRAALRCRRLLAGFWQPIEASAHEPDLDRLRIVLEAVDTLTRSPHYRSLRIADRRILHELRARTRDRLRTPHTTDPRRAHLLRDVEGFIALSRRINDRMELVDHDRAVLRELKRYLASEPDGSRPLPLPQVVQLHQLRGLAPSLDACLPHTRSLCIGDVLRVLQSLEAWSMQRLAAHGDRGRGPHRPGPTRDLPCRP